MNALTLITSSLRLLGVLASGEAPSSAESTDALSSLNDLIDSWSNEQLLIPNKVREVFPLVASQQTYTMGTGGNFNTSRAQKIENCLIQLAGTSPLLELPMTLMTKDEYAAVLLKTLSSSFPLFMYNDHSYPLDNINVWPVPSGSTNSLVIYSWKPLSTLAALTTAISLPPGYLRALRYALALELSSEYGRPLPEPAIALAIESKAAIKRMNYRPHYLQVDEALRVRSPVWNWMTGDPT